MFPKTRGVLTCNRTGFSSPNTLLPENAHNKNRQIFERKFGGFFVVEMAGVEPASESTLTGLSPGADGYCGNLLPCSPSGRQAVTRIRSGESHDAWAGQLFPASRTPHKRRLPRPVASPVQTAALIRQQQQDYCCYLIYNCPFLGC